MSYGTKRTWHRVSRKAALRLLLVASFLVATSVSAFAAPQSQPDVMPQTPFPAPAANENDIRVVYVAVLDKKEIPVSDLTSDDFSVFENKAPQQIVSVSLSSDSHIVLGAMIDVSGSAHEDTTRHDKLNVLLRFLSGSTGSSEEAYISAFAMKPVRLTGVTANLSELFSGLKQVDEANSYGPTAL